MALGVNAMFSLITGITLLIFPESIATAFGSNMAAPFWIIGIGLILFAAFVYYERKRHQKQPANILLIILMDLSWVIGSIALVYFDLFELSQTGHIIISVVAMIVLVFAVAQYIGFRKLTYLTDINTQ